MYVMLIAPPGIGKSMAIREARAFWSSIDDLNVARDSLTRASLVDELQDCAKKQVLGIAEGMYTYHSLLIPASEFGVFVPGGDLVFMNTLNDLYDCPSAYSERRRGMDNPIDIANPSLHIIGGTQPAYLQETMRPEAWGQGFPSRCVMVYAEEQETMPLFQDAKPPDEKLRESLVHDLTVMTDLWGEVNWEIDAATAINEWNRGGRQPAPSHIRLQNYNARRVLHLCKLCIAFTVAAGNTLTVTREIYERALSALLEAEARMGDIFKAMGSSDDERVLHDLYTHAIRMYGATQKPVAHAELVRFLSGQVPTYRVKTMLEIAREGGYISWNKEGQGWVPQRMS